MDYQKKELESSNAIVIERINSSVSAGVKIRAIADKSLISYFRIASVINVKAYRYKTSFNKDEISQIHKALDVIKGEI